MRACILILWLLGVGLRAICQTLPGGWIADEGLRDRALRTLVSASDGLLWVATDDGVYRYDGTRLVSLNALRRAGPSLPAVPCSHLLFTPDGALWLGTESGVYRFTTTGELQALPLPGPQRPSHVINALLLAPDQRSIWVGQDRVGLQRYSLAGQPAGPLLPTSVGHLDTWVAPDSTLWLIEDSDWVRHLSPAGRVLSACRYPHRFFRPVAGPAGRVWLLSTRAAYEPKSNGELTEVARWQPAGPERLFDLIRAPDAVTLLCREKIMELSWGIGPDAAPQPRFEVSLPPWRTAGWSARLRADRSGNWWVFDTGVRGTWRRAAVPAFIQALPGPGGMPYSVRAMARLPDGRLLVSAYEEGALIQPADSALAPLRHWPAVRLPDGHTPVLMSILRSRLGADGQEWLAGSGGPFLTLHPRTGQLRPLPAAELAAGTPDADVRALARDPATGRVWGGARTGLYVFDSAAATFRSYRPPGQAQKVAAPFAGRTIEDVWADGRGHLWLATPEGVIRLTPATGAQRLYGPTAPLPYRSAVDGARCLLGDKATGRLWVGTRTHGLLMIEPSGGIKTVLTEAQGLPDESVATILPGPDGALWLGTYQGLVRYQPSTAELAVFTTAHGLVSDEFNARAALVDTDGSLLLGGVWGLHRIWPDRIPRPASSGPRLVLTGLTVLSASADSSRTRHRLTHDPVPALHLAPHQPLVDLHLALTDYLTASKNRYFYRVVGWLENRWVPLGTTPMLRLQGLPPGQYEVQVRGETSQGVAATNVLRLPLTVTAEWWRRPAAWGLGALLAVLLVYVWQRGRLLRARRETALRASLAADLHDEVGALLTRVTLQAEVLREFQQGPPARLEALVEDSRAAAATVRDIIWSVDTAADTLGALVDRIRDHLDATARATGWVTNFDARDLPADLTGPLPPAVRQHVYLIFKEAVTNALRHAAHGTTLTVELGHTSAQLELRVRNDGCPEATDKANRAGQGLRNMRHRAALLRAELVAGPLTGGGWEVELRVPL